MHLKSKVIWLYVITWNKEINDKVLKIKSYDNIINFSVQDLKNYWNKIIE